MVSSTPHTPNDDDDDDDDDGDGDDDDTCVQQFHGFDMSHK